MCLCDFLILCVCVFKCHKFACCAPPPPPPRRDQTLTHFGEKPQTEETKPEKVCVSHGVSSGLPLPAVGVTGAALLPVFRRLRRDAGTADGGGVGTLLLRIRVCSVRGLRGSGGGVRRRRWRRRWRLLAGIQLPPAVRRGAAGGGDSELLRGEFTSNSLSLSVSRSPPLTWMGGGCCCCCCCHGGQAVYIGFILFCL